MNLKDYETIQRWRRQLRKRATKIDPDAQIPHDTWRQCKAAITKYCEFAGMNPDEIYEDARNENRTVGDLLKHKDLLDKFWEQYPSKTTAGTYVALLKGFYGANEITLSYKTGGIPKIKPEDVFLKSQEIRAICDVARLSKHKSWILANNYMGLRIGAFPHLTVDNFLTNNWIDDTCIYPVFIPRSISGTFDYHAFIGNDAMQVLKRYFKKYHFSGKDRPWNCATSGMNAMLKAYAYRAGLIDTPEGLHQNGVPRGYCKIHSHLFRKRVQTTLETHKIHPNITCILIGHIPRVGQGQSYSIPEMSMLKEAYLEILSEMEIYGHHKDTPIIANKIMVKRK